MKPDRSLIDMVIDGIMYKESFSLNIVSLAYFSQPCFNVSPISNVHPIIAWFNYIINVCWWKPISLGGIDRSVIGNELFVHAP